MEDCVIMSNPWRAFWGGEPELDQHVVTRWTSMDAYIHIHWSYTILRAVLFMQIVFLFLWCMESLVPGFALYDGTAGRFNAISHIGWWVWIEAFTIFIGALSNSFNVQALEKGLGVDGSRIYSMLGFTAFCYLVAIVANIVHLIASALELSNCSSTLCMDWPGFLTGFIVLLSILIFVECCALYYVAQYRKHIRWGFASGLLNNAKKLQ